MSENTILKKALDTYGFDMQSMVAVEELSELTKEIIKFHRGDKNIEKIAEEVADVYIMLKQISIHFDYLGFKELVLEKKQLKIDRLEKILERI